MGRKAVGKKGKRSDIVNAAYRCFLKNGYDGTSIREIMKEANAEVGLFYYYFDSKDDAYREVQQMFINEFLGNVEEIVENASMDSFRVLKQLFDELASIVTNFYEKYGDKLHDSVLRSLREYLLVQFVPYVKRVLEELVRKGAKLHVDLDTVAQLLTYGVGGIISHNPADHMARPLEIRKCFNLIMGLSQEEDMAMNPQYATKNEAGEILLLFAKKSKTLDSAQMLLHLQNNEVIYVNGINQIDGCVVFDKAKGEIVDIVVQKVAMEKLITDVLLFTARADIEYYRRKKKED